MNKFAVIFLCSLISISSFGQEKKNVWKQEKELLKYEKERDYKGPEDWYGTSPADMKEDDYVSTYSSGSSRGIQYVPQQIQRDRSRRLQGFDRGGGGGTVPFDPEVQRPDPIDVPDIDAPDVDLPDIDVDAPSFTGSFWKILLFILIAAAVLLIIYLLVKNKQPSNRKVVVDVEDDWNPEIITKTELELRLEEAMEREDYRECVRIYFTFILKELISKNWIVWKKEKTNYHYVLEMNKRPDAITFNECVRIYDLIWYGEYHIDKDIYSLLEPTLSNYHKSLEELNE